MLAKAGKQGNLCFYQTEKSAKAGNIGMIFFQTSALNGRTPIYHNKSYKSEMALRQDLLYRFGIYSRIILYGNTPRVEVTLDYTVKHTPAGDIFIPNWEETMFLEEFADLLRVGKGDLVKEYSFEKETSSFQEAITNGRQLYASTITGEKAVISPEGELPDSNYQPLYSRTRMIDPEVDEKYENRIYTEKAKEVILGKANLAQNTQSEQHSEPEPEPMVVEPVPDAEDNLPL